MTCDEYQEQVSQYIDGELDDKESGALFKHLSTCGECRSFLRSTLELRSKIHDEMLMEREGKRVGMKRGRFFDGKSLRPAVVISFLIMIIAATAFITTSLKTRTEVIYVTSLPTVEVQGISVIKEQ
jgi:hypothetical protein